MNEINRFMRFYYAKYKEIINYLLFGILTTIINYVSYLIIRKITHIGVQESTAIAWFISVLFAYITNKIYVFDKKSDSAKSLLKEIILFFTSRILSGLIDVGTMWLTVVRLGQDEQIMKLLSNIIIIILNYFFSKLIVFKNKPSNRKTGEEKGKSQSNTNLWIISVIIFVLFLFISICIPLTGDDWTNANFNTNNLFKIIQIALAKYSMHEGRIISRIFVIFFTNTKWAWNLVNALMLSSMYFLMCKVINPKYKNLTLIMVAISILLIENSMFTQSYLWVTGNCTYVVPMLFFIIYIYCVDKIWSKGEFLNNMPLKISIGILIFLTSMMVENISATLVFTNIILLIYYYVINKKINKVLILYLFISTLGFLVMVLSPGLANRALENRTFYNLNLIQKCICNIPNFIEYTYTRNAVLMCLMSIIFSMFIYLKMNKVIIKIPLIIYTIIPLIMSIVKSVEFLSKESIKAKYILKYMSWIINGNNMFIIIYWIIFTILMFYLVIKYLNKKSAIKIIFFLAVGLFSNFVMLISPIWGGRTSLFTVYMLYIFVFLVFNNIDLKFKYNTIILKIINILLNIFFGTIVAINIILYYNVLRLKIDRNNSIKNQINQKSNEITYELYPEYALHNANAWNEFHQNSFKQYYHIADDLKLARKKNKWKYFIIYQDIK